MCVCVCEMYLCIYFFFVRGGIYLLTVCYFLSVYIIYVYVNKYINICILDFMHIDFPFTPLCIPKRKCANRKSQMGGKWGGRGDIFFKLCDIIILRFPGVKSNAQTQHFAGGVRSQPARVFFFLIYLLKSFLKALNRYGVFFFYTYTGGCRSRSFSNYDRATHLYVFSPRNDIRAKKRHYYY